MHASFNYGYHFHVGEGCSRVTLKGNIEQGSDYINASFIDVTTLEYQPDTPVYINMIGLCI